MVAIAGSKNKNCRDNQNWTINKRLKDIVNDRFNELFFQKSELETL